ncbi:protein translocase subunit SecF [Chondromyces apiculatus]|uniref:Protein-export membrane protein SecF n=1 Tax=Chondromyces apiculatus DSM 436 TaxID=1192034 RepID=A0A017TEJ4_9BACT|nr:protein translocase subunit SecF [Chondromyces apiculatus]EYF07342.1 Protein-export membrane protein SecF [Chondromyces apiculatus DSM 436]
MELIKPGRQYDFMGKRWLFIGFSGILLLLSIFSFIKPGPKLGTDFKGGTEIEVAFTAPVSASDVREAIEQGGFSSPDVVAVSDPANPNRYLIRVQDVSALGDAQKGKITAQLCHPDEGTPLPADRCPVQLQAHEVKFSPGGDKIAARYEVAPDLEGIKKQLAGVEGVALREGANNPVLVSERDHKVEIYLKSKGDQLMDVLRSSLGADKVPAQALRVEWIGPKAGDQLRDSAIKSVLVALLFIMAYVAFRFDVRFAPGGIIALIHDVGIALGAMVITQREITLSTVAALLTIVGYSITDTVVVYDRIRENLSKHRDKTFAEIINLSISEMLGRTILVSCATALSLVMFFIWGTGTLKDFAFTLVVGIVVGTYSSIYVAAPLTEWIDRRFFKGSSYKRKKVSRVRADKRADAVV